MNIIRESQYWRIICDSRFDAGFEALATDPWCRRMLSEAAVDQVPCGADGHMYRFRDGSQLIATSDAVVVL